jgi:protease-4
VARRHPIARGIAILCIIVVAFFAVAFGLTVGTEGDLSAIALGGKVGVVEVEGVISESDEVVDALKSFGDSPGVKAVVVRVESPGGGVAPSQEIYEAIRKLRKSKPVIASFGGVAASGGYYVASACDAIVANPGTITGSIGVIMELGNLEGLLEKIGVRPQVLKSGEHKDMGSPLRALTDEERTLFQEMIDSVHSQFINAVAKGRDMDEKRVRELADGRIYSGEQALAAGLVDVLGGLEDAINLAAERGGIVGEPRVSHARARRLPWWFNLLFDSFAPAGFGHGPAGLGLQLLYGGPFLR